MLHREDVGIEISNPLFAFLGDPQIAQRISDVRPHLLPEEIGIIVSQISDALVSQFFARPCFPKLVEQGGLFSKIVDVGKLPDQIGGPHKTRKVAC